MSSKEDAFMPYSKNLNPDLDNIIALAQDVAEFIINMKKEDLVDFIFEIKNEFEIKNYKEEGNIFYRIYKWVTKKQEENVEREKLEGLDILLESWNEGSASNNSLKTSMMQSCTTKEIENKDIIFTLINKFGFHVGSYNLFLIEKIKEKLGKEKYKIILDMSTFFEHLKMRLEEYSRYNGKINSMIKTLAELSINLEYREKEIAKLEKEKVNLDESVVRREELIEKKNRVIRNLDGDIFSKEQELSKIKEELEYSISLQDIVDFAIASQKQNFLQLQEQCQSFLSSIKTAEAELEGLDERIRLLNLLNPDLKLEDLDIFAAENIREDLDGFVKQNARYYISTLNQQQLEKQSIEEAKKSAQNAKEIKQAELAKYLKESAIALEALKEIKRKEVASETAVTQETREMRKSIVPDLSKVFQKTAVMQIELEMKATPKQGWTLFNILQTQTIGKEEGKQPQPLPISKQIKNKPSESFMRLRYQMQSQLRKIYSVSAAEEEHKKSLPKGKHQ